MIRKFSALTGLAVVIAIAFGSAFWFAGHTPEANALRAGYPAPPGGDSSGIQVYGRWTVEVRDPGGSLASVSEFENSLTDSGGRALARLLGHATAPGAWIVWLHPSANSPTGPCGHIQGRPLIAE